MNEHFLDEYLAVRENGAGLFEFEDRGLIEVSGTEAVMFLSGLITNDVKTLPENSWINAAFPNAQGRLLAIVKCWKAGDKFYFETEDKTYETVWRNLERFTLAGDFKVCDLSEKFICLSIQGKNLPAFEFELPSENQIIETEFDGERLTILNDPNIGEKGFYFYVSKDAAEKFKNHFYELGVKRVSDQAFEVLRVEAGLPLYGVDVDDSTVVPEIGLPQNIVNYNKGCYIGQEVIARIHFRGHVAKKLTGLIFEAKDAKIQPDDEIRSLDGKNAGKITSVAYSPKLEKLIALAYVRYAYLEEKTELKINDFAAKVKDLPFVK